MIIPQVSNHLIASLSTATEVYIAVALVKDYGLNLIEKNIPTTCNRHYLVGIDLPTSPSVLEKLFKNSQTDSLLKAKIYKGRVYHPKVYIVKDITGELSAFVGSGNATLGGMDRNVEMTIKVQDSTQCNELLNWFNDLFRLGAEITEPFLIQYAKTYRKNALSRSRERSNIDHLLNKATQTLGTTVTVLPTQFFRQSDYDALAPVFHYDDSQTAKGLRKQVWERLRLLDRMVFSEFSTYGINDLHRHTQKRLITSLYFHVRGYLNELDAIWLNYGKSAPQLKGKSFTDACRIQVIIRNNVDGVYVGIWLFIGKDGSSIEDRQRIRRRLNDAAYCDLFYQYYQELGDSYWIHVNGKKRK